MKKCIAFVLVTCLILSVGNAHALSILLSEASYLNMGYGKSGYSQWTAAVDTAAGNNTHVTSNLENYSEMLGYDALIVNLRSLSYRLTATETVNVQNYMATGRRVLLVAENDAWENWNRSVLSAVGGTYDPTEFDGSTASALTHELLNGVGSVHVRFGSLAGGGTSLFTVGFANLWGSGNVLTVQDINIFSDDYWNSADNGVFAENMAGWLAASTPTPIPGAVWLLGSGLLGLAGIRWKRKA